MTPNPHIHVPIFSFFNSSCFNIKSLISKVIQKRTVLAGIGLGLFIVSKACVPSGCG